MYIETSYPRKQDDYAVLRSPPQTFGGKMCLSFFYHMFGSTIGSLNVSVNGVVLFSKAGNQGNKWVEEKITISDCGRHPVI